MSFTNHADIADIGSPIEYSDLSAAYNDLGTIDLTLPQTPTTSPQKSPQHYQWISPKSKGSAQKPIHVVDSNPFLVKNQPNITRSKTAITPNEYKLMAHVYKTIINAPEHVQEWFMQTHDTAKNLSILTGAGRNACISAVKFANSGVLEVKGQGRTGRPKKEVDQDVSSKIMTIIADSNKKGILNSAALIANQLKDDFGIKRSASSITRDLHKMGLFWGKGIRQNFLHDSKENVAFRLTYLKRRLKNLKLIDDKWVPRTPEVFLDESYCHIDHSAANRWVLSGGVVNDGGRKPIMVIFAAFVVYYDEASKKVEGRFVKDSVYVWPSKGPKPQSKRGREQDAELWNGVLDEIREAGAIAVDHDYHGNFNATIFDAIFERLCNNLNEMGVGPCKIHLDGASYHFHKKDKKPTRRDTMDTIKAWLSEKEIVIPEREDGKPPKKDDLMALVSAFRDESYFSISKIAKDNGGHEILKTPPYHCELQPIEKIWAVVKNLIASRATTTATPLLLKGRLLSLFSQIPSRIFYSVWKKSVRIGMKYYNERELVLGELLKREVYEESTEEEAIDATSLLQVGD